MRRVGLLAIAVAATTGCATTWAITEVSGHGDVWDDRTRELAVPSPGVTEALSISIAEDASQRAHVDCVLAQSGTQRVFHQGIRYDKSWKKEAAVWFALEAGTAATILALSRSPAALGTGGFFAGDALVTGALALVPMRYESEVSDPEPWTQRVRTDCPDGLTIALGGRTYPVDAAGQLGADADVAIAAAFRVPAPTSLDAPPQASAELAGRHVDLRREYARLYGRFDLAVGALLDDGSGAPVTATTGR